MWVYFINGVIYVLGYVFGLCENGQVVEGFGCLIIDIVFEDYVEVVNVVDMNGWYCNVYWMFKDCFWQVYIVFL